MGYVQERLTLATLSVKIHVFFGDPSQAFCLLNAAQGQGLHPVALLGLGSVKYYSEASLQIDAHQSLAVHP